jgi:HKD family nuclease
LAAKLLSECQAAKEVLRIVKDSEEISLAVAWVTEGEVTDALLRSGKVSRAVIGTHMYVTSPVTLRRFASQSGARMVTPDKPRLFHPKVYLFRKGTATTAVVGSHNLTSRAFSTNVEASVLIEGETKDAFVREMQLFIKTNWQTADDIDDDLLFAYERQHEAKRPHQKALEVFRHLKRPTRGLMPSSPLESSWKEFVHRVKTDDRQDFMKRLVLLERARKLFALRQNFAAMEPNERKAIAGTNGSVEPRLDDLEWGWFGTMFGHGDFMNLVNEKPEGLSVALDHIPLLGDTTKSQYEAFVADFRIAFKRKAHKGSYPVASRLLAMKRPDVFVAVNSQNRRGLCNALSAAHSTLDLDNYWQRIVEPIRMSAWWLTSRPMGGIERRLWDCRAAMLDSIFYEG